MSDPEVRTVAEAAQVNFQVGGTVEPGFERVRDAFAQAQARDRGGAQLFVYHLGRPVVNLWAGRDPLNNRAYDEGSIAVLMSCTKAAVATCAHMLAERGQLDIDARVADYWPEFARNGKAGVRVRHLLAHSAGLMGFEPESGIGAAEIFDWRRCVAALEDMAPLWPPGEAYFYHPVTFGVLVGEVIRRVSGRTVGRFFADEVAGPLGLDLWIGLPEDQEHRFAPHFSASPSPPIEVSRALLAQAGVDVGSRLARTILHTLSTTEEAIALMGSSRDARAVEVPAGNGVGDARSLARMYAALIGEVDGVRLIGPETLQSACAPQLDGMGPPAELAVFAPDRGQNSGLGFGLPWVLTPMLGPGSFGHSGAGGRLGFAHPGLGVSVGYVCNTMINSPTEPDPRWVGWTRALHEALGA